MIVDPPLFAHFLLCMQLVYTH